MNIINPKKRTHRVVEYTVIGVNAMIRIKISELLGKHKMTQKALAELTGIRPATISKMYYEEVRRVEISHINNICKVFGCELSEVLEYVPD